MEIFLDCLPCMLRQVLEASRIAAGTQELQEKIIEDSLAVLADYKKYRCSPEMGRAMHQIVKKHSGVWDPYEHIKQRDIKAALQVYPLLQDFLHDKEHKLYWALKTAAVGNIIDSALYNEVNIADNLEQELAKEFSICDLAVLENKLKKAKSLMIIGDNAGETVFDKILAEYFTELTITYAVRHEPIINDATAKEAYVSGLGYRTRIVSSGCNAPGTILKECSEEFLNIFEQMDIIISKGQGNFEALSDQGQELFFLLKAKCPMIARKLGVNLNGYVFRYNPGSNDQMQE